VDKISESDTAKIWEGLTRAHHAVTAALEKDMVPEAGISVAWYEVLDHLTRAPLGMMRFGDLAKVAGITDSGASRRLEQMIKADLIDRHACPTDRRGAYAHITEQGLSAHRRAQSVFARSLRRNLDHLEPGEADSLLAVFDRLARKA
jgi:DNA-binding MarR family transcriptional regulator